MIRAFMDSTEIVDYGTRFLRVMSLSFVFLSCMGVLMLRRIFRDEGPR